MANKNSNLGSAKANKNDGSQPRCRREQNMRISGALPGDNALLMKPRTKKSGQNDRMTI